MSKYKNTKNFLELYGSGNIFDMGGGNFSVEHFTLTTIENIEDLKHLPNMVEYTCSIRNLDITELNGNIKRVGNNFVINSNKLTTLKNSPDYVGGAYRCSNNKLLSLEGISNHIGGAIFCDSNNLVTLEGIPKNFVSGVVCENNTVSSTLLLEGLQLYNRTSSWLPYYLRLIEVKNFLKLTDEQKEFVYSKLPKGLIDTLVRDSPVGAEVLANSWFDPVFKRYYGKFDDIPDSFIERSMDIFDMKIS